MTAAFPDTSALAKLYHLEAGTQFVEQLLLKREVDVFVSRLAVVEMNSVIAGKVRTGVITEDQKAIVRRRFRSDVRERRFRAIKMRARHFETAENLINVYGTTHGLRTLDALQLAVALDLRLHNLLTDFVAADRILCEVASREGLVALNPETAPL